MALYPALVAILLAGEAHRPVREAGARFHDTARATAVLDERDAVLASASSAPRVGARAVGVGGSCARGRAGPGRPAPGTCRGDAVARPARRRRRRAARRRRALRGRQDDAAARARRHARRRRVGGGRGGRARAPRRARPASAAPARRDGGRGAGRRLAGPARGAWASTWTRRLPLAEAGRSLSSGQRRRLALARVLGEAAADPAGDGRPARRAHGAPRRRERAGRRRRAPRARRGGRARARRRPPRRPAPRRRPRGRPRRARLRGGSEGRPRSSSAQAGALAARAPPTAAADGERAPDAANRPSGRARAARRRRARRRGGAGGGGADGVGGVADRARRGPAARSSRCRSRSSPCGASPSRARCCATSSGVAAHADGLGRVVRWRRDVVAALAERVPGAVAGRRGHLLARVIDDVDVRLDGLVRGVLPLVVAGARPARCSSARRRWSAPGSPAALLPGLALAVRRRAPGRRGAGAPHGARGRARHRRAARRGRRDPRRPRRARRPRPRGAARRAPGAGRRRSPAPVVATPPAGRSPPRSPSSASAPRRSAPPSPPRRRVSPELAAVAVLAPLALGETVLALPAAAAALVRGRRARAPARRPEAPDPAGARSPRTRRTRRAGDASCLH